MGLLIISLLIFFFELTGYMVVYKLNIRTKYSIIFGFLLAIALFEIISLPFSIFQCSFSLYLSVTWSILILFYIILFKCSDFNKGMIREWINSFNKTKLIVYITGSIVGIYMAVVSINILDSWLYMPIVLKPIQTNSLEHISNVISHSLDGYYKFLSFLTYYTGNDIWNNYMFLMFFYKFFEVIIVVNFFGFISEQIFEKKEKFVFYLLSIGLIFQIVYLLPSYTDIEFILQIYKTSPNGTLFLEVLIIPFLFIYLYKDYRSNKLLLIILLAGLGFSASMIYIYSVFLITYIGFEIFVKKKYYVKDYVNKLLMLLVPSYVLIEYYLIGTYNRELVNRYTFITSIIFLIIFLVSWILIKLVKKEWVSKEIYIFSLVMYICLIFLTSVVIGFVFRQGYIPYLSDIISKTLDTSMVNSDKYAVSTGPDYNTYWNYGLFSFFYIVGLYVAFKEKRKLFILHILVILLVANYVAYQTLGSIISHMVYHRVYILASCYIFVIIGIIYIWEKIIEKDYKINHVVITRKKKYFIVFSLLIINFIFGGQFIKKEFYKFDKPFIEYKLDSIDDIEFLNFDFQSPYVQILNENDSNNSDEVKKIFQLNTELIEIDNCKKNCYIIENKEAYEKEKIDNTNIVYETENYIMKYVE